MQKKQTAISVHENCGMVSLGKDCLMPIQHPNFKPTLAAKGHAASCVDTECKLSNRNVIAKNTGLDGNRINAQSKGRDE